MTEAQKDALILSLAPLVGQLDAALSEIVLPRAQVGDPTYADAILGRLVHNAARIDLTGESLRKQRVSRQQTT